MRGLGALTWAYLLQSFRSKTGIFWNLFFPLVWLFLFAAVFAQGDPETASLLMPGVFTLTIVSASFFGTSYLLVNERELGILRRYRVTPVTAATIVLANGLRGLATMAVSLALQALVGWLIFGIRFRGSILELALLLLLGAATFIPLGL
ncbi:MAG: ABC transporter permease, partial [Acidobacteriota bacterium]